MKMNALLYIPGIFTSTDPHKYAYISKRINPIIIISSDLDSTINFALERHVFGKSQLSPFFFVLKGLCPLNPLHWKLSSGTPKRMILRRRSFRSRLMRYFKLSLELSIFAQLVPLRALVFLLVPSSHFSYKFLGFAWCHLVIF